jgi:hypothetical protein
VIIHTHLENIVLIRKIIALKVARPPQTRECKERESQGTCRVSETNERGTEKLSTFALPSEGSVPLKGQYFFDEGLYSK